MYKSSPSRSQSSLPLSSRPSRRISLSSHYGPTHLCHRSRQQRAVGADAAVAGLHGAHAGLQGGEERVLGTQQHVVEVQADLDGR